VPQHPDDVAAQANLAEAYLTTGRMMEADRELDTLLGRGGLEAELAIPLAALQLATRVILNPHDTRAGLLEGLRARIAQQPQDFRLTWSFEGTRHFITQDEKYAPSRPFLLALLDALTDKDGPAMVEALDSLRAAAVFTPEGEYAMPQ
jgi:hypothetical protein